MTKILQSFLGVRSVAERPSHGAILQAVANGDVSAALSAASIFAETFPGEPAEDADLCADSGPSAAARFRILATMAQLDAVTYSSSTYILQVCTCLPRSFLHQTHHDNYSKRQRDLFIARVGIALSI